MTAENPFNKIQCTKMQTLFYNIFTYTVFQANRVFR